MPWTSPSRWRSWSPASSGNSRTPHTQRCWRPVDARDGAGPILLVEDETSLAEIVGYNLQREGLRVVIARDGRQGLERFKDEQPSLVILDLMLPEVSGLD